MKKALKRSLSLLLAITIIMGSAYAGFSEVGFESLFAVRAKAATSGTCGYNLNWTLDDYGTLLITGSGSMYSSSVPWADFRSEIKVVVFDADVSNIGSYAFDGCTNLKSVIIPDSVINIDNYAFRNCQSLTSIEIPDSVTSIGWYVFDGCTNLNSITLPNHVIKIDYGAFLNTAYYNDTTNWQNNALYIGNHLIATKVDNISGSYSIKSGTKFIADRAFEDCTNLSSVTLPNSVIGVGNYAFEGCTSLRRITLPDSITSIGNSAFYNTAYSNDSSNWHNGYVLYIGNHLVDSKDRLSGSYTIKSGTKTIANSAFFNTSCTTVIMPDSLVTIGDNAFESGNELTSVTIPDSVTQIGYGAFLECTSIVTIKMGSGIMSIGDDAFYDCDSLSSVHIDDVAAWCNIHFESIYSNPVYFANNLYVNGKLAGDIVVPDGVASIGASTFSGCESLKSIEIPDSVTSIDNSAFYYCTSLTSITIPDSVTSIGNSAFYYCTSLASITIPDSVTSIGDYAFRYCTSLAYVFYSSTENDWSEISIYSYNTPLTNAIIHYNATDHTYQDVYVAPTCNEDGELHKECTVCSCVIEVETIPTTGHSYSEWVIDVEAVCTEVGSKHKTCSACGEVVTEEIPATGHQNTMWITEKEPTCTEAGYKDEWCLDCAEVANTQSIPATGHPNTMWLTEKEPTCTQVGSKDEYCLDCAELINTEEIPAIGHNCENWVIDIAPTCTEEGSKHQICSACEENVTEAIPSLGHNYSTEWTIDIAPTCTKEGSKSHHCTTCGDKIDVTMVDPLGHIYSNEWTIDIAPTCIGEGSKSHHCVVCGDKADVTVIEPTGHTYSDEWTIDIVPTCTEEGSKSHHCITCYNDVSDVTVVAALGHDYKLASVADEHPHTKTYKCSRCPEKMEEESYTEKCGICNFSYTDNGDGTCKITGYIGNSTSFTIPVTIDGKTVVTTNTGAFKSNTNLISAIIEDGVQNLGALTFLGCSSLSKIVIPESVTSIGANAFYNCASDFTIYCFRDSYAMQYAIDNSLNYVIMDIGETESCTIDYDNELIFVSVDGLTSIEDVICVPTDSMVFAEASLISGANEFLGTGSIITVFDGADISSEYTLIVNGDTNGDSVCDALDAAQVANASNGLKSLDGAYAMAADSNADDIVDIDDYQAIVNKVVA